ncbi:collagen alpha-1(I) chain-like [Aquila chrysaetos chrysaetos]|uniref:collagen alpha-1(I) chain-like n=1 Tax=Aquila chrysaetos chrysaetos TaxID=223781 RepID=UPI0011772E36|nr:collagen alpha-1(I) chain-like [Aquila chrysaetos chrysaetos]
MGGCEPLPTPLPVPHPSDAPPPPPVAGDRKRGPPPPPRTRRSPVPLVEIPKCKRGKLAQARDTLNWLELETLYLRTHTHCTVYFRRRRRWWWWWWWWLLEEEEEVVVVGRGGSLSPFGDDCALPLCLALDGGGGPLPAPLHGAGRAGAWHVRGEYRRGPGLGHYKTFGSPLPDGAQLPQPLPGAQPGNRGALREREDRPGADLQAEPLLPAAPGGLPGEPPGAVPGGDRGAGHQRQPALLPGARPHRVDLGERHAGHPLPPGERLRPRRGHQLAAHLRDHPQQLLLPRRADAGGRQPLRRAGAGQAPGPGAASGAPLRADRGGRRAAPAAHRHRPAHHQGAGLQRQRARLRAARLHRVAAGELAAGHPGAAAQRHRPRRGPERRGDLLLQQPHLGPRPGALRHRAAHRAAGGERRARLRGEQRVPGVRASQGPGAQRRAGALQGAGAGAGRQRQRARDQLLHRQGGGERGGGAGHRGGPLQRLGPRLGGERAGAVRAAAGRRALPPQELLQELLHHRHRGAAGPRAAGRRRLHPHRGGPGPRRAAAQHQQVHPGAGERRERQRAALQPARLPGLREREQRARRLHLRRQRHRPGPGRQRPARLLHPGEPDPGHVRLHLRLHQLRERLPLRPPLLRLRAAQGVQLPGGGPRRRRGAAAAGRQRHRQHRRGGPERQRPRHRQPPARPQRHPGAGGAAPRRRAGLPGEPGGGGGRRRRGERPPHLQHRAGQRGQPLPHGLAHRGAADGAPGAGQARPPAPLRAGHRGARPRAAAALLHRRHPGGAGGRRGRASRRRRRRPGRGGGRGGRRRRRRRRLRRLRRASPQPLRGGHLARPHPHPHHRPGLRLLHLPAGHDRPGRALPEGEEAQHLHLPGQRLLPGLLLLLPLLQPPGAGPQEEAQQVGHHAGAELQRAQQPGAGAGGGVGHLRLPPPQPELLLPGLPHPGVRQDRPDVPQALQPLPQHRRRAQPLRGHRHRLRRPAARHHLQRQHFVQRDKTSAC